MEIPDLATLLNEIGAGIQFETGSNREILVVPKAIVNFDTVTIDGRRAKWSNAERRWVPA